MKTLIIFLVLISIEFKTGLLVIRDKAQNRFDKEFTKADQAFLNYAKKELAEMKTISDSAKYWQMISSMEDTAKITLTVNQCLHVYITGYLNGGYDRMQSGEFDIDSFWEGVIKQHKALSFQIIFFKLSWKDSIKNLENAEFVDEVSFNEGIPFNKVTQKQFNKRYEIK